MDFLKKVLEKKDETEDEFNECVEAQSAMWAKTEIEKSRKKELMKLLHEAENLVGQYTGGYSGEFLSAEEFHLALAQSIEELENDNHSQLYDIYMWFLPTSCWDDFTGKDGSQLANRICKILSEEYSKSRPTL